MDFLSLALSVACYIIAKAGNVGEEPGCMAIFDQPSVEVEPFWLATCKL